MRLSKESTLGHRENVTPSPMQRQRWRRWSTAWAPAFQDHDLKLNKLVEQGKDLERRSKGYRRRILDKCGIEAEHVLKAWVSSILKKRDIFNRVAELKLVNPSEQIGPWKTVRAKLHNDNCSIRHNQCPKKSRQAQAPKPRTQDSHTFQEMLV